MTIRTCLLFALLWVVVGCAKATSAAGYPAPSVSEADGAMVAEDEAYAREAREEAPMAAPPAPDMARSGPFGGSKKLAEGPPPPPPPPPKADAPPGEPTLQPPGPRPAVTDAPAVAGPLLIYTANLTMGVFETVKAIDAVEQLARTQGGYLVIRTDESITIRVPAERFVAVLGAVMKLGDVLGRNVEVRDITEEYFDLQTRLRNQEAVLERLKQLLAKAEKVEDALKVEAELARVATEVESLKGRLKLLRELVAYSTITVTFAAQATEHVGSKVTLPFGWLGTLGLGKLLSL